MKSSIITSLADNWKASFNPSRERHGQDIYQVNIAVVTEGSLEQLIDSIAKRI